VIADELEAIAATFAEHVRACRVTKPAVLRAVAELERLAVSFRVVSIDVDGEVWLSAAEVAAARGVSVRTVERWAAAGRLEAKREGWQWSIRQDSSTERGGSPQRARSNAAYPSS
jgi:DNA-directed RNA polymerase specialized sigma24 family protein